MRRLAVAAGFSIILVAGCAMRSGPDPAAEPEGPTLVLDVTNESDRDVVVGYDFESAAMSGTGESFFPACRREATPHSTISGDYRVVVDGEVVLEDSVPPRASADTFLVVRMRIAPDGEVEVVAPGVMQEPLEAHTAIPGCGAP